MILRIAKRDAVVGPWAAGVGVTVYVASEMHRDKQYVIFPSDRASARIEARWLAMMEFGVQRPANVDILETKRFEDRRGSTGSTVWVRVP